MDQRFYDEATDKVKDVLKRYPFVNIAYIFGSFAKLQANAESDIDIMVDIDTTHPHFGLEFAGLSVDLEEALNRKVDLFTIESMRTTSFYDVVIKEAIVIYEK